ncbi:MAG: hypothetical protein JNL71_02180 [Rhodospirillales bacterium]|nr:hypothetical protein [Rhodospirillales bacterium]
MTAMRSPLPVLLVLSACGLFMASCGPAADGRPLFHPTLGTGEQTAIRNACASDAQRRLGPAPASASPAACREGGDAQANDRCRAQADLALVAETRYFSRVDAETAACLRANGFRD